MAAKPLLGAFFFLPSAFCLLPSVFRALSKRNRHASGFAFTIAVAVANTITNTAAESASMGRGDAVSRLAVGSRACDRANAGRSDVVCH